MGGNVGSTSGSPTSAEQKRLGWLPAAASAALVLNGLTSVLLLAVAAWLYRSATVVLPTTRGRDEFAAASLVGTMAIGITIVIAVVMAAVAAGC